MLKLRRRRGQGMTEYIIIVGLIAILLIAAVNEFKGTLSTAFESSGKAIKNKVTKPVNEVAK